MLLLSSSNAQARVASFWSPLNLAFEIASTDDIESLWECVYDLAAKVEAL
jgi:hypothetical protein